jgi:hypothetical protein
MVYKFEAVPDDFIFIESSETTSSTKEKDE